ncbi:MAG: ABC transporter permease, partial [Bryobacteraceae bacterium]
MNAFLQDISYGFRVLLKNPAVTLVAVLSIALGVGVNSTVFSWVDAVLLHPLPGVANQNEVVAVKSTTPEGNTIDSSYPDFRDLRDQSTLFSGWIAAKQRPFNLGEQGSSERVWAETVTGNYFDVLGVRPLLGRTFNHDEQDERFGAHRVAVLSERLWHRKYNGDPRIVGQTILINRQPLTVIGVVPAEFRGVMNGLSYDLWLPLTIRPLLTGEGNWLLRRTSRPLQMLARLKPGVTLAQAQSEIDAITERLGKEYPQTNERIGARALTLWDTPDGATSIMRVLLEVLLAVGALVLLIVCANVANLLLARATARRKEFAIRLGLGAGRGRLLRQLLTESFLLAFAGAMAGLLFTVWFTGFIDIFIPPTDLPVGLNPTVNAAVIGWTVVLAFLTTFLCGAAPAVHAAYSNVNETLKAGGRGTSSSAASNRLRGLLVVGEVALAVVALIGAGLFVKSFHNAQQANPGFDPSKVLLAGIDLSTNGYTREQNLGILRRVTASMASLPGVEGVVFSEDVPLGLSGRSWEDFQVPGYVPHTGENMKVWRNLVGPDYFQVLQIPLLDGREFTALDTRENPYVMIVNQTFVRRFLNGGPAVGRIVHAYGRDNTIVGVARDGKYISIDEQPTPY